MDPEPIDPLPQMPFRLRSYQVDWVDAINRERAAGLSRLLVDAPGGVGKSTLFAALAFEEWTHRAGRTLVLENRDKLVRQTADRLTKETGLQVDIEMAGERASPYAPIVVASVQTLGRVNRLTAFSENHFSLLVPDEAHYSLSDGWQRVMRYFHYGAASLVEDWEPPADGTYTPNCFIVGTTATPDIGKKKNLGQFFQKMAVRYTYAHAVRDGWLVGPIAKRKPLPHGDLRKIRVGNTPNGKDLNAEDLSARLIPIVAELADQIVEFASDRKTIAFTPSVECARLLSIACIERGLQSVFVSGDCIDKDEKTEAFEAMGPGSVLTNCSLYNAGWDHPPVDCVAWFRPTISRAFFCLDEKTEILTASGWSSDVKVGELIAAFDPNTEAIKYVPAIAVGRREMLPGETFVSLRSRSADIRVTDNHRMLYDHKRRTGWKITTANHVASLQDPAFIPVSGLCDSQVGVPISDDDLRFIGIVMTDGTINKKTKGICISQAEHQPWVGEIDRVLVACGLKHTKIARIRKSQFKSNSRAIHWTISFGKPRKTDKHLSGWGRLERWLHKEIAEPLMSLSPDQFDVLMEAIHLGDGMKFRTITYKRGTYHIVTGNRRFADRLQILGTRCGYRSSISTHTEGGRKNPKYVIHLKKIRFVCAGGPGENRPGWMREQPVPGERCWCAENEIGTLVTRRNGRVAIVGNCQGIYRGTRVLPGIVSDDQTAEERREAIAKSPKKDLLIIDPLWQTEDIPLCSFFDLYTDKPEVKEKLEELPEGADLAAAAEKGERDWQKALEKAAAKKAKREAQTIDPLAWALSLGEERIITYEPKTERDAGPLDPGQVEYLTRNKIDMSAIKCYGQAAEIISTHLFRWQNKLASPEQLSILNRLGLDATKFTSMPEHQVRGVIGSRLKKLRAYRYA